MIVMIYQYWLSSLLFWRWVLLQLAAPVILPESTLLSHLAAFVTVVVM